MSEPVLSALVGAGAALLGAAIGAGTAVWIYKQQRAKERKQELVEALQGLVGALALLRIEHQRRVPLRRLWDRKVKDAERPSPSDWLAQFGSPWIPIGQIGERYVAAMAQVLTVASQSTLVLVDRANALLEDWTESDWGDRADSLQVELVQLLRSLAGAEPPPSGQGQTSSKAQVAGEKSDQVSSSPSLTP